MSLEQYGITISQSGIQVRAICPQCSPGRKKAKDKCLSVNTQDNTWFCHHCGWSGGETSENKVFEVKKLTLPENVIQYFTDRGIPEGILNQELIGFVKEFGKGWVIFPYFRNSVCVNKKYRTATKDMRQEKGGAKCLYRLDKIRSSNKKELIITEGEIDTLSFLTAGFEATSVPDGAPTPGCKTFNSKFDFLRDTHEIFDRYEKIILAGDNDEPGQALIHELGRRIGFERCYVVKYPDGCKDANDVLKTHGIEALRQVVKKAQPYPVERLVADDGDAQAGFGG